MPGTRRLIPEPALAALGRAVSTRRHRLGLSQERLAEAAGLHRTYLGSLERGERNPTVLTLLRVASAVGCSVTDLVTEAGL
jgi:transcriptional regulator with XRE-family HTH domain